MVAPQHYHLLRTVDLHRQNQQQHLDRKIAAVHVVPQEHVLRCLAAAPHLWLQQFEEIVELSVEVADDGDGVIDGHQVWLGLCLGQRLLKMEAAYLTMRA